MNSFYSNEELKEIGLKSYGKNVLISRNANIYGASQITIGDNVRIDDFCILSGKINIGSNIHISAGVYIYAGDVGVELCDYSGVSAHTVIYAISDDFSGEYMTNSTIPIEYRNVIEGLVYIGKYVQIGSGCIVLPGVKFGDGAAIGAMSLVNKDVEEFSINYGIPCRKRKERSKKILKLESNMKNKNI